MQTGTPNLPLSEQTYFILLSLQSAPRHGYVIAKDIRELSGGRVSLSVSTLYTTLKRLLEDGWIQPAGEEGPASRPRKTYRLTGQGANVLQDEVRRLETLISAARTRKTAEAK